MAQSNTQLSKSRASLRDNLRSDKFMAEMKAVLPEFVTPERMVRVALTAIQKAPKLAMCSQESFFACMLQLSSVGLEPDGRLAHLIPFKDQCQLIIDYKGLVSLAYRSGGVSSVRAEVVNRNDVFEYSNGSILDHVPWYLVGEEDSGDPVCVYSTVKLAKSGECLVELMPWHEVESIRSRSLSGSKGPWVTDPNEMAKKSVFRRQSKWLPLSNEYRDALTIDADAVVDLNAEQAQQPSATVQLKKALDLKGIGEAWEQSQDEPGDEQTDEVV